MPGGQKEMYDLVADSEEISAKAPEDGKLCVTTSVLIELVTT